jgi:GNAT superfamily N-acetyltransferase
MIKEAELHDAPEIARIIVSAWKSAYKGIIDQSYVDNMKADRFVEIMKNNIEKRKENIFLYRENEKAAGFISGKLLDNSPYDYEIVGLYVLPEFQNMGTGAKLLGHAMKFYSQLNCRKMIIWTLKGAKNNSFYIKKGGIIAEEKILNIGDTDYAGIAFGFDITS